MPPLLEIDQLDVRFTLHRGLLGRPTGQITAVDQVSLVVEAGEIVALVGESGCGKTSIGRAIVGLERAASGRILFNGVDIATLTGGALSHYRRAIGMVFQDPYSSLSPRQTIGDILGEPLDIHGIGDRQERRARAVELLRIVGLDGGALARYPHQFSGGQRQRIGLARALAVNPRLLVCDEPVAALDVSVRAQIVNLLLDLRAEFGVAYLFIAHDLGAVRQIADRVAVMYFGRLAELAPSERLFERPVHPYTRALWSAVPIPDPTRESQRRRIILKGEIPSPLEPPSGCRFRTRCPIARPRCAEETPAFRAVAPGHHVACHYAEEAVDAMPL